MGAVGSMHFSANKVLSNEQYDALSESQRLQFQKDGQDLIESKATDLEIHLQLTLNYSRMMEELKRRDYSIREAALRENKEKELLEIQTRQSAGKLKLFPKYGLSSSFPPVLL